MAGGASFQVEIIRNAPRFLAPLPAPVPGDPVDVTDRLLLEATGSVNRALDRDLLSFRTGDMTLAFDDDPAFFADLFAFFGVTDRWQIRIFRRDEIQFWGVILGLGSITLDRKARTCEITAYGLTRQLQDVSAETVKRTLAVTKLNAQLTAGATSATVDSTALLLTGDVLHVTDHVNSEDLTVKQTTSATVVSLEAPAVNTYASGSPVTATTPYYRYESVDFLVRELFRVAGIPVAQLLLDNSQFRKAAPTPVNLEGLNLSAWVWSGFGDGKNEAAGRVYATLATGPNAGPGTYRQDSPSSPWAFVNTDLKPYMDVSRYFKQSEAQDSYFPLRGPVNVEGNSDFTYAGDQHLAGIDMRASASVISYYFSTTSLADVDVVRRFRRTGAGAWDAGTNIVNKPDAAFFNRGHGCEFDPRRAGGPAAGGLYLYWRRDPDNVLRWQYLDLDTLVFSSLLQADDTGKGYFGACYVPEFDYVLALRGTSDLGPAFEISAWRGTTRLWVRPFPGCLVKAEEGPGVAVPPVYPTHSLRYVNGSLYCLLISDGALQILRSDDEFQSFVIKKLANSTVRVRHFASRIGDQYRIFGYQGSAPRGYLTAAPFYAGVVSYADFEGKSCAEALKDLAVLTNALFWVDDNGQGHFVARDLYDPGAVTALDVDPDDRLLERSDQLIWDQSVSYVEVSGGGSSATSGLKDFSSSGLSLSAAFVPNEAFAQALADSYYEFFGRRRAYIESPAIDPDGRIYQPLDRVTVDGIRHLVYESDHDLAADEVSLRLLEDA